MDDGDFTPPYLWATNRRATIHSYNYLRSKNINTIYGEVVCTGCRERCTYEFDLEEKLSEIDGDIQHDHWYWYYSQGKTCTHCGRPDGVKPVIPKNGDEINWLFLFLGQFLGFCTKVQLNYFCKLSGNESTHIGLCQQLNNPTPVPNFFQTLADFETPKTTVVLTRSSLPENLILYEILPWLPIRSLARFKCVSVRWYCLLSTNVYFAKLHLHRSAATFKSKNSTGAIMIATHWRSSYGQRKTKFCLTDCHASYDNEEPMKIELPFHIRDYIYIHGSCNGLLCLSKDNGATKFINDIYVWNPCMKDDYITIPTPQCPSNYSGDDTTTVTYGFGFHPETEEYKLVRILNSDEHIPSHVCVYTVGGSENSWKVLQDIQYKIEGFTKNKEIRKLEGFRNYPLVNGALHWIGYRPELEKESLIIAFDLKNEIFQEISRPPLLPPLNPYNRLLELGGLLCLSSTHYSSSGLHCCHIWMMKEYGMVSSWTKQYVLNIYKHFPLKLLHISNDGEIFFRYGHKLHMYDPRCKSMIEKLKTFRFGLHQVYSFTGSLISPMKLTGTTKKLNIEIYGRKRRKHWQQQLMHV